MDWNEGRANEGSCQVEGNKHREEIGAPASREVYGTEKAKLGRGG